MATDFGELRSLIHNPTDSDTWRKAVWSLIQSAYEDSPDVYLSQWLPYLCETPGALWRTNLDHFNEVIALDRASLIAPFARFGLSLRSASLEPLLLSSGLRQLTRLELWIVNGEASQWGQVIDRCGQLTHLMVGACGVNPEVMDALVLTRPLPSLIHLNVQSNQLTSPSMEVLASSPYLTALETVCLFENQIDATSIEYLACASWLPTVRDLNLGQNRLECDGVGALAQIESLNCLEVLNLSLNDIRDEGCARLAQGKNFERLHTLNLSHNSIGMYASYDGIVAFASSSHFSALKSLDLESNSIGDVGLSALANSTTLTALCHLDLDDNDISDEGATVLASSSVMRQLKSLSMMGCELSFSVAMALEAVAESQPDIMALYLEYDLPIWFEELKYNDGEDLYLSDRELTDSDMALLAQWPGLSKHESFHLNGSSITDQGLASFLGSPHLKHITYLDLSENAITQVGLKSLTEAGCLRQITSLALLDSGCNDDVIEHFIQSSDWPMLEDLDLSYNTKITSKGALALANSSCWPSIKTLDVSGIAIEFGSLIALLTSPISASLESFESECILGAIGEVHRFPLNSPRALRSLALQGDDVGDDHIELLASLPHLALLDSLEFGDCLTEVGARTIANSDVFGQLNELTLSRNPIGDLGFGALASSSHLKQLKQLMIVRVGLTDDGVLGLNPTSFPLLNTLVMGGNSITARGLAQLLACLPDEMDWLSLWGSTVGDEGAALIAQHPFKGLRRLCLDRTGMTDVGLTSLLCAPWLSSLEHLALGGNPLTNHGAEAISKCEVLREIKDISIRDTSMDEDGIEMIHASPYISDYSKHWIRL